MEKRCIDCVWSSGVACKNDERCYEKSLWALTKEEAQEAIIQQRLKFKSW